MSISEMMISSRHGLPSWIDGLSRPLNGLRMTEKTVLSYLCPLSLLTISFIEIAIDLVILHDFYRMVVSLKNTLNSFL